MAEQTRPDRVALCLGCHAEWQALADSPTPGHEYDLIGCRCPIGAEPEFVWADENGPYSTSAEEASRDA